MTEQLHPEEIVTSIIFVRHGHTKQTEQGRLYTDHAAALTDKGLLQAASIANWLAREKPELLFASTADRVLNSADIISKTLSLPIVQIPGLNEQNVGDWEGRSYLEIKKEEPDLYKKWCNDPIRNRAPGGESLLDVFDRVSKDINKIIEENAGKKIVLVTHAGVIRSAIIAAMGMPIDNLWRIVVATGSASKVDYSPNFATMHYMSFRAE